jgi:hypothetical protein
MLRGICAKLTVVIAVSLCVTLKLKGSFMGLISQSPCCRAGVAMGLVTKRCFIAKIADYPHARGATGAVSKMDIVYNRLPTRAGSKLFKSGTDAAFKTITHTRGEQTHIDTKSRIYA